MQAWVPLHCPPEGHLCALIDLRLDNISHYRCFGCLSCACARYIVTWFMFYVVTNRRMLDVARCPWTQTTNQSTVRRTRWVNTRIRIRPSSTRTARSLDSTRGATRRVEGEEERRIGTRVQRLILITRSSNKLSESREEASYCSMGHGRTVRTLSAMGSNPDTGFRPL